MAPRAWFKPLSVSALLLAGAPARPQDAQVASLADESILLQEIPSVYGASKHEQKTSEAPSSVTIVTAADIQQLRLHRQRHPGSDRAGRHCLPAERDLSPLIGQSL